MPSTGLKGPYTLDNETIDKVVTRKSTGTYALGNVKENTFYVYYVGRSDSDVNSRLKQHVGEKSTYTHFKYDYFGSPKASFEKECNIWHDFGGPEGNMDNKSHPDRPDGTNWKCPKCDHFNE